MSYQHSEGSSVTHAGTKIVLGIFMFALIGIVPYIANNITGFSVFMEPRNYIQTAFQKDVNGVTCTAYNAQTQLQQLNECRIVAFWGIQATDMFKVGMISFFGLMVVLGVVGILWGVGRLQFGRG